MVGDRVLQPRRRRLRAVDTGRRGRHRDARGDQRGGDYEEPMPVDLVARLVAMGWQEPDEQFRNCWAMAHPADVDRFEQVAQLALDGAEFIDTWSRPRSSLALSADGLVLKASGRTVRETAYGGLLIEGHNLGDEVSGFW